MIRPIDSPPFSPRRHSASAMPLLPALAVITSSLEAPVDGKDTEECAHTLASLCIRPLPMDLSRLAETALTRGSAVAPSEARRGSLPSILEMDATIASWKASNLRHPERRGSHESDASWMSTPALSPGASDHPSPPETPGTPPSAYSSFSFPSPTHQKIDFFSPPSRHGSFSADHRQEEELLKHLNQQTFGGSGSGPSGHVLSPQPLRPAGRDVLSPVSEGVTRKRRQKKETGKAHFNKKYDTTCTDLLLYLAVDLELPWELSKNIYRETYKQLTGMEDAVEEQRETQGIQGVFYRLNHYVPAIDAEGRLLFNEDGKEYTVPKKQREQLGRKLGLVDRYPERVAWYRYHYVDPDHMARAITLTEVRNAQRKAHGVPSWTPTNEKERVVHTYRGKSK